MSMKLSKIYDVKDMNSFQFIALTGVLMTLLAHVILWLSNKHIASFWALYVCWAFVFIAGTILNFTHQPGDEDHHHHG